jgi:peptide/nickel transport system permease protein
MNRSGEKVAISALGNHVTPDQVTAYVAEHGLDRPVLVRYLDWLGNFVTGNWGQTLSSQLPVKTQVLPAFLHTTELAVVSLAWSLPVAIVIGVFMARRGGKVDAGLLVILTVVAALPEFVLAIAVLIFLAVQLGWFPADSSAVGQGFGGAEIRGFVLPALTLGLGVIPYVSRITRASVSDALAAPFTRNAVLRGLPRRRVVWGHATRTASVPLVNAIALNIIYVMGGVIVIENVFAFPGLGRLLVNAIAQSDANSALAIITLLGVVFIAVGLVADVAVTYLNPRLREG